MPAVVGALLIDGLDRPYNAHHHDIWVLESAPASSARCIVSSRRGLLLGAITHHNLPGHLTRPSPLRASRASNAASSA
jgi:hypothetical protein